jgi:hypothetical protein
MPQQHVVQLEPDGRDVLQLRVLRSLGCDRLVVRTLRTDSTRDPEQLHSRIHDSDGVPVINTLSAATADGTGRSRVFLPPGSVAVGPRVVCAALLFDVPARYGGV